MRISFMGPNGDVDYGAGFSSVAVAYNPVAGEYLAVWAGSDNSGTLSPGEYEIYAQRVDAASGVLVGGRVRVSNIGADGELQQPAADPAVVYNPAQAEYLITWWGSDVTAPPGNYVYEIFVQRLNAAGVEVGTNDQQISDMGINGYIGLSEISPGVAYNPTQGEYLITWRGSVERTPFEEEFEIYVQRLTAAGVEVGTDDQRISDMGPAGNNGYTAGEPAVAYNPAQGEYLISWWGDDDTAPLGDDEYEIFAQRLTAAGIETGLDDQRISDAGPPATSCTPSPTRRWCTTRQRANT